MLEKLGEHPDKQENLKKLGKIPENSEKPKKNSEKSKN